MLKPHFEQFARYNRWANERLYQESAKLSDEQRKRDIGLFFRSLHGTLNHLLLTDRSWMRRLTGVGEEPDRLDLILFDGFDALKTARENEDARILAFVARLSEAEFEGAVQYDNPRRKAVFTQRRADILAHLFNHQTHHRGQAHAALTILGVTEPAPLDLLALQRAELRA